jgi:hypothetical protein
MDIKERRVKLAGYHGTFKGDCRICHREHLGGTNSIIPAFQKKFNHDLTSYKLEGKHARLECDECHKKLHPPVATDAPITSGIYFIGLKSEKCTDCHRDLHNGQFAVTCEKCHSANVWTGKELKFSHDKDSGDGALLCCCPTFPDFKWTKKPHREMLSRRRVELNQVRFAADTAFALVSSLCQPFSFLGGWFRRHQSPRSIIFIKTDL